MIWSRPELQVLFVCTANICRSPLAEGMLRHRLNAEGVSDRVQVRSAGTHAAQRGCRPDPRVEALATAAGVSLAGIRAKLLTPALIKRSDYVLVMEHRHLEDVRCLYARYPDDLEKILLLGSFLPAAGGTVPDIPDPYFGDLQGFHNVYQMVDSALAGFTLHIRARFDKNTAGF